MPFYYTLKRFKEAADRKRVADGLLRLYDQLAAEVPARTTSDTLLLATWNIREFDSGKYGLRSDEPLFYIAEIVSRFDLVAVQEVNEDLRALDRLQEILGGSWNYIVTDVTEGSAGARERMAFLYDTRKVSFGGLAGEIVLPDVKGERVLQMARTPFVCGFRAGWSKFNLCIVHIYWGDDVPDNPRRIAEIDALAKLLAKRTKADQPARPDGKVTAVRNTSPENLILLGDFNIFNRGDHTMKAITDAGFTVPPELQSLPVGSNVKQDRHYDQIAIMTSKHRFGTTGRAGVFNFFKSVYRDEDETAYGPVIGDKYAAAKEPATYYKGWRTHQMSDHLVMWVELKIDYGREYLAAIAAGTSDVPV